MAKSNRDDFSASVKLKLAKRAGFLCSHPLCRRPTIGSASDGNDEINVGMACHISAAAPGGPRYDASITADQRRSADNGIWLCRIHGTAVDANDPTFTTELLRDWKAQAQRDSWSRVVHNDVPYKKIGQTSPPRDPLARLREAVSLDLDIFRRSTKWPATTINLTLEVDGIDAALSTSALATTLTTLDDLVLVAPPGMGKTATMFQIADAAVAHGDMPIVVSLAEWSTNEFTLLEDILKRPAFQSISEADFRRAAARPGVILLLDGWNELDSLARRRVTTQVARLQMELPRLSFLISTRKQALDVPINGTLVELRPINDAQQLSIAKALRGDAGARLLDEAWRTPGVRELVTVPLYLTSLLSLPEGSPFPTTKEEVLRRFVAEHEKDTQHIEVLLQATQGCHQRYLDELAIVATGASNTAIADAKARSAISDTSDKLLLEGQIAPKPAPNSVLDALVSHHVLVRTGDPAG